MVRPRFRGQSAASRAAKPQVRVSGVRPFVQLAVVDGTHQGAWPAPSSGDGHMLRVLRVQREIRRHGHHDKARDGRTRTRRRRFGRWRAAATADVLLVRHACDQP